MIPKFLFILTVVQNTLIGRSKKSIGNATFTTWKGINVLKSKPITVENPNTVNQQNYRNALTEVVSIFREISNVIVVGWKELAVKKSEYNAFTSQNLREAFDYATPPNPVFLEAAFQISRGTIATQPILTGSGNAATEAVTVTWDASVLQPGQSATDKALIVVLNSTTSKNAGFVTAVSRSANTATVTFPYPVTAADELWVYLGFYNPTSGKAGDSQYINVIAA